MRSKFFPGHPAKNFLVIIKLIFNFWTWYRTTIILESNLTKKYLFCPGLLVTEWQGSVTVSPMLLENTVGSVKRTIGSLPVERAVRTVLVIQLVRFQNFNGNGNGWKFKGHIIFSSPIERLLLNIAPNLFINVKNSEAISQIINNWIWVCKKTRARLS